MKRVETLLDEPETPLREKLLTDSASLLIGEALSEIELVPRGGDFGDKSLSTLAQAISYCVTHLSEDLSLDILSKKLFVTSNYLSKLFRTKLEMGYVDFISEQRILTACDQLCGTRKSVTEIAYDCGFRNQSSFNRVFRKKTGMTPREWRRASEKGSLPPSAQEPPLQASDASAQTEPLHNADPSTQHKPPLQPSVVSAQAEPTRTAAPSTQRKPPLQASDVSAQAEPTRTAAPSPQHKPPLQPSVVSASPEQPHNADPSAQAEPTHTAGAPESTP